jgi:hypothetical protein
MGKARVHYNDSITGLWTSEDADSYYASSSEVGYFMIQYLGIITGFICIAKTAVFWGVVTIAIFSLGGILKMIGEEVANDDTEVWGMGIMVGYIILWFLYAVLHHIFGIL